MFHYIMIFFNHGVLMWWYFLIMLYWCDDIFQSCPIDVIIFSNHGLMMLWYFLIMLHWCYNSVLNHILLNTFFQSIFLIDDIQGGNLPHFTISHTVETIQLMPTFKQFQRVKLKSRTLPDWYTFVDKKKTTGLNHGDGRKKRNYVRNLELHNS